MIKRLINFYVKHKANKIRSFDSYTKSLLEISSLSRNDAYNYFHQYFHHASPPWLVEHRAYFSKESRSFGEDAFHSMWLHVFNEFKPKKIIEIGVYRGSTLSLFSMLSKQLSLDSEIHGISPFTHVGDSVSQYLSNLDYEIDVINNFKYFNLDLPVLHKGLSQDASMIKVLNSDMWDLIFIDGNHDEEIVEIDLKNAIDSIAEKGIIVLDDSALFTDYVKLPYSTVGHPGPSKVATKYVENGLLVEVLSCGHNRVFKKLI